MGFKYVDEVIKGISEYPGIIIYGARIVAREVAGVLMNSPYNMKIDSFMVSDPENNPSDVFGVPVRSIDDAPDGFRKDLIIIASVEKYLPDILDGLRRRGFFNILPLTFESDIWSEIRANSYMEWYEKIIGNKYLDEDYLLCFDTETGAKDVHVFRAISHMDRKLYENTEKYSWEIPIQVGKALTENCLSNVHDAIGEDNISDRNSRFCEITALYWIWKNDTSLYKGLCHYRRHFELDEKQRNALANSDADVVLTIPIYNTPDVYSVYAYDHLEDDWKVMIDELEKIHPEYVETAEKLAKSNWYYAYNMLIAKKEVFDDYCSFLFPVLFACEKRIGIREEKYQGRYVGFLAERLLSIYFMKHRELKIVHCKKHFIGG